jgi:hypothetical protein
MTDPKTSRCRAATDVARCSFRGTRDELRDHADEMGHPRCICCADTLGLGETQTCVRCAINVRDDLDAIAHAYAHLERVIWDAAYRTGRMPGGNALVYLTDGSVERPLHGYETDEPAPHPLARTDETAPPKIRDEWPSDPLSVLAVLESNERDWRHEFGHGPAVDMATVAGCLTYLRTWHWLAVRTHPGFDDYATTIHELRSKLEHVVGMADDPARGAPCACGAILRRDYGQDDWTCPGCGTVTTRSEYLWRLRLASHVPGFVSVAEAARDVGRPMRTVQTWARLAEVPVLCIRVTRRVVVELAGVRARSAEVATRERRAS